MNTCSRINIPLRTINGETALFVETAEIRLLFPAERIEKVYCSRTDVVYEAGIDYRHPAGTDVLVRLPESRIPILTESQIHPRKSSPETHLFPGPNTNAIAGGVDGEALIFDNLDYFSKLQIEVDYTASTVNDIFPVPVFPARLPRTKKILAQAGTTLQIMTLGDSITEGLNASAYFGVPPFRKPYPGLVADMLENACPAKVNLCNQGVDGTTSRYPIEHPEIWHGKQPHLMIIAYGMNDFSHGDATDFLNNLQQILTLVHQNSPDTEFLLVASMSGNPLWKYTPPGSARKFATALQEFVSGLDSSVSFVDQCALWETILSRKGYYDLTGNGVNHPNDFGHNLLAENICRCIIPEKSGLF